MAEAENFTIGCRSRQSSEKSKIFFEEETSCYDYVAQLTHSALQKCSQVEDFWFFFSCCFRERSYSSTSSWDLKKKKKRLVIRAIGGEVGVMLVFFLVSFPFAVFGINVFCVLLCCTNDLRCWVSLSRYLSFQTVLN